MTGLQSPGLDRILSAYARPTVPPELKAAKEAASQTKDQEKLRELAGQFEAFFMNMMMKTMRQSLPENAYLDGGLAEDVYTQMFDDILTQRAAEAGRGYGIAEMIVKHLEKYLKQ